MAKRKPEPHVEISLLSLEHKLAATPEERKHIRDINRAVIDLARVRLAGGPLANLIDRRAIGPEELRAAQDIDQAFSAISLGMGFKPISLERKDKSREGNWPAATIDAVHRYQDWANHWSMRAKLGDKSFEICIAVVIDERGLRDSENDAGVRNGLAGKIVPRLLRDYAARAGWVTGHLAAQWKAEAGMTFKLYNGLSLAISRHAGVRLEEALTVGDE